MFKRILSDLGLGVCLVVVDAIFLVLVTIFCAEAPPLTFVVALGYTIVVIGGFVCFTKGVGAILSPAPAGLQFKTLPSGARVRVIDSKEGWALFAWGMHLLAFSGFGFALLSGLLVFPF